MAKERTVVRARCIRATAADYNYYYAGREYLLDLDWAEDRDILKHFQPIEEVQQKEAEEEVRDGMIINKKKLAAKRAEQKAEATGDPKAEEAAVKAAEEAAKVAKK